MAKLDEAGKNHDASILELKEDIEQLGYQLQDVNDEMQKISKKLSPSDAYQVHKKVNAAAQLSDTYVITFSDDTAVPAIRPVLATGSTFDREEMEADSDQILASISKEFEALSLIECQDQLYNYEQLIEKRSQISRRMLRNSYQIIGDNLDFYIHVKHMTSQNQNRSIHWFNMLGIESRIAGLHEHYDHDKKKVAELESADFIPSREHHIELMKDIIQLTARVIVDNIPAFKQFRKLVTRHIPHKYSEEMAKPSVEVSRHFITAKHVTVNGKL